MAGHGGHCQGTKKTFSFFGIFFLESNTDRNTRFFLAVAVAYFAYFGSSFCIPVSVLLAAFWTARAMRRQHAMRTCHHHVPPPRRGRLPTRSAVYSSSPLCLPTERTGNQARTARAPAIEQGNSGNCGNGGGRGELLTAIYINNKKRHRPDQLKDSPIRISLHVQSIRYLCESSGRLKIECISCRSL